MNITLNLNNNNYYDYKNNNIVEIKQNITEETKNQMLDYQDISDTLVLNDSPQINILEKIESKKNEVLLNTKHACHKLGLDSNYLNNKLLILKNHEDNSPKLSIKDSTFTQEYGDIHRNDTKKECMHCEKLHQRKIYSSPETNKYVDLFQEHFLKIKNMKKDSTMVGAATVSLKDKIIKTYLTHSGNAPEGIKEIYNNLGANIIDYTEKEEKIIPSENDKSFPLFAIHSDNALKINNGNLKTLYGKTLESYNIKNIIENQKLTTEKSKLEILELQNEIDSLTKEKNETKEGEEKKRLGKLTFICKEKIKDLNKIINQPTYELGNVRATTKILSVTYGGNFGHCAAQKIMQQISKDFGELLHKDDYTIHMSEAWIQQPNLKPSIWSQIHPVPSCETCAFIVPNMLCEKEDK